MPRLVGVPRVLRFVVHVVGTPSLVAVHVEGLGSPRPRDGHQGSRCLLQSGLLQAEGHLQKVNFHLEGLYFDWLAGLFSEEKREGTPTGKTKRRFG